MISTGTLRSPFGTSELSTTDNMSSPLHYVKQILDIALIAYKKETGSGVFDTLLSQEIETCDSVEAVLNIIQHQAEGFDKFRAGDKRLIECIGASVHVLYKISSTLGEAVGMVCTINP